MTPQRPLRLLAIASTAIGIASFTFMHLAMPHVHPVQQPVSMFALEPAGAIAFIAGTFALATTCAALAIVHPMPLRLPLAAAAIAFVMTVVFPTDPGRGLSTVAGHVHRYSSGTAFGCVIIAGFIAAGLAMRTRRGQWTFGITVVNAIAMLTITVNTFFPEFGDGGLWRGLPQRILLAVQAVLLLALAYTPIAASRRRRTHPPAPPS